MTTVWLILGMVAVTYGIRLAPFMVAKIAMPPRLHNVLDKVPAAVLAALVTVPVMEPTLQSGSFLQPEFIAAVTCLALGLLGAQLPITVVVGMGTYWVLLHLL